MIAVELAAYVFGSVCMLKLLLRQQHCCYCRICSAA